MLILMRNRFQFPRVPGRSRPNEADGSTRLSGKSASMVRKPEEFWRPPTNWDYLPNDPNSSQHGGRPGVRVSRPLSDYVQTTSSSYSTHLQQHIRRMEAANPKIILERIKEEWTEVEDTVYKELEFEKHLWMLTGLKYLAKRSVNTRKAVGDPEEQDIITKKTFSMTSKVLSLFENQGKLCQ
jgi:hypothetical protein